MQLAFNMFIILVVNVLIAARQRGGQLSVSKCRPIVFRKNEPLKAISLRQMFEGIPLNTYYNIVL